MRATPSRAPFAGSAPNANSGKAYAHSRSVSTGAWSLQATLQSPSGAVFIVRLGETVAASDSRISVVEGGSSPARILSRVGSPWSLDASVTNSMESSSTNYTRAAFLIDINLTDCDAKVVRDECDIASGTAANANTNGIPVNCDRLAGRTSTAMASSTRSTSGPCSMAGVPARTEHFSNPAKLTAQRASGASSRRPVGASFDLNRPVVRGRAAACRHSGPVAGATRPALAAAGWQAHRADHP